MVWPSFRGSIVVYANKVSVNCSVICATEGAHLLLSNIRSAHYPPD